MIINVLKKCCEMCGYPDIETETNHYANRKDVYIYCTHDKVCKYYNDKKESDKE